ncbi:MAG: EF-hand domain-containing protein [Bradyrhizobium sp.]|nr:EF-hand domain-containing protein [Bradyrhizobium sp.]
MLLALGAASSAIDALQALTSSKSSSAKSTSPTQGSPFDLSGNASTSISSGGNTGGGGSSSISPQTMSALLAAQSQSPTDASAVAPKSRSDALKDLFSQIDGNGDGKITKSEFEDALGAGGTNLKNADDVFAKLDKDGDGSVSLEEMSSALKGGKGRHHAHNASGSSENGSSSDPLMQALQGASTTSVTNSDGSVTTSLTYADGSKVTMTSAASGASSSTATSSYNFIEQMIQRQAQAISTSATTASLSVSA